MGVYFIFVLVVFILWITFVSLGYKSLQILNEKWDNYKTVNVPVTSLSQNPFYFFDRVVLIEFKTFDKWMKGLIGIVAVAILVQIKITSDYAGLQSNRNSKLFLFLNNSFVMILLALLIFVFIATFSFIVANRINSNPKDPQVSLRKSYNITYLLFTICGGLLFPVMLMIAYNTPLVTSENTVTHEEDSINKIVNKIQEQGK
jgi:hypothetical protein